MHKSPTAEQCARSFDLWQEFIDPLEVVNYEDFEKLTYAKRLDLINQTFPQDY